ncbi:MAG: hypothetical protein IKN66_06565 [Ruminococcus sp.]|nr:hypothetical protein [Ruminococcus sp.]
MFEKFLKYVNYDKSASYGSAQDFINDMSGKSFLDGMYRFFAKDQLEKWTDIVERTFQKYKDNIIIFAYDWLGRVFAVNKQTGKVLLFEPGTGEVLNIPVNIHDFHEEEIVDYSEDSLASAFFEKWFEANGRFVLPNNKCAGYKIPLFLNGDDTIENLEVSDMEVYWEIMMPLINA